MQRRFIDAPYWGSPRQKEARRANRAPDQPIWKLPGFLVSTLMLLLAAWQGAAFVVGRWETLDMVRQAEVMAILLLLPAPWILTIMLFKALRKLPDEEPRLSTAWTQRARLVMMVLALSGVAYVLLFLSLRLVVAVSGTSS